MQHTHYAVIDLEATCDENHRIPREETEIIEIGLVMVDAATLKPTAEFQTFVRPQKHAQLTEFCTQLTTITQTQVDTAPTFPQAMTALRKFLAPYQNRFVWCSWGDYDRAQFERDARRHRVALPLGNQHINLKLRFSEKHPSQKRMGTAGALRALGIRLEGTHHRGIDDARNIAKILPFALGQARIPNASSP